MGHGVQRRKCRRRARQDVTNGKRVPAGAARGPRSRPKQEVGVGEKKATGEERQFSVLKRSEAATGQSPEYQLLERGRSVEKKLPH